MSFLFYHSPSNILINKLTLLSIISDHVSIIFCSVSIISPVVLSCCCFFCWMSRSYFFPLGPLTWLFSIVPTPPNTLRTIILLLSLNRLLFLFFLVTITIYFCSHWRRNHNLIPNDLIYRSMAKKPVISKIPLSDLIINIWSFALLSVMFHWTFCLADVLKSHWCPSSCLRFGYISFSESIIFSSVENPACCLHPWNSSVWSTLISFPKSIFGSCCSIRFFGAQLTFLLSCTVSDKYQRALFGVHLISP